MKNDSANQIFESRDIVSTAIVPSLIPLAEIEDFLARNGFRALNEEKFSLHRKRNDHKGGDPELRLDCLKFIMGVEFKLESLQGAEAIAFENAERYQRSNSRGRRIFKIKNFGWKEPFRYKMTRTDGGEIRFSVVDFYLNLRMRRFLYDNSDIILHFCSQSRFSAWHPTAVEVSKRVLVAPGVFSYSRYRDLNRFRVSKEINALERKYPSFAHLDIAKFYSSIYTHSISWVTNGKSSSKQRHAALEHTFGGQFDRGMRMLNNGQTNGIVIGPEYSLVFAEIILQHVDVKIEKDLLEIGLKFGVDYEIFRFEDDFLVFATKSGLLLAIEGVISRQLAAFDLELNQRKKTIGRTPISSEETQLRLRVESMVEAWLGGLRLGQTGGDAKRAANDFILEYKGVLLAFGELAGMANNVCLDALRDKAFRSQNRNFASSRPSGFVTEANPPAKILSVTPLLEILDAALFVYSLFPSLENSVKLVEIMRDISNAANSGGLGLLQTHIITDKITRETIAQINARLPKRGEGLGFEVVMLMIALIELNSDVDVRVLQGFVERIEGEGIALDAFVILALLHRFRTADGEEPLKKHLLKAAGRLLASTVVDGEGAYGKWLLKQGLVGFHGCSKTELAKLLKVGIPELQALRKVYDPSDQKNSGV